MSKEMLERYRAMHLASAPVTQSPQDLRDYIFGSTAEDNNTTDFVWDLSKLPSAVDLLPFTEKVEDQGQYGSCVGHGIITAAETMYKRAVNSHNLSPMYAYYNARRRMQASYGGEITDSGAYIRSGMAAANRWGLCKEDYWPYYSAGVNEQPSTAAYSDGATRLVSRYETCGGVNNQGQRDLIADIKVAIACGYPVVFGVPLLEKFYYISGKLATHVAQYTSKTITGKEADFIGNHCMCIIGYDDALQAVIVENSWGPYWGDGGFVALSYEYLLNNGWDFYVLRDLAGVQLSIPSEYYLRAAPPAPEPEPIPEPQPEPIPDPQPEPQPEPQPIPDPKPDPKFPPVLGVVAVVAAVIYFLVIKPFWR
jgi:hypothetical protein